MAQLGVLNSLVLKYLQIHLTPLHNNWPSACVKTEFYKCGVETQLGEAPSYTQPSFPLVSLPPAVELTFRVWG